MRGSAYERSTAPPSRRGYFWAGPRKGTDAYVKNTRDYACLYKHARSRVSVRRGWPKGRSGPSVSLRVRCGFAGPAATPMATLQPRRARQRRRDGARCGCEGPWSDSLSERSRGRKSTAHASGPTHVREGRNRGVACARAVSARVTHMICVAEWGAVSAPRVFSATQSEREG